MEFTRLFEIPYYQQEKFPQEKAFGHRLENGELRYWSIDQFITEVNQISFGLLELGVQKGDKIALISYNNRPEWNILDIAIQQVGAINVPVYPTISPREFEYIFNDAEVKYCFVGLDGPGDLLKKVRNSKAKSLKEVYTFDKTANAPYWEDLKRDGDFKALQQIKDSILPEHVATFIYTSGTTGNPKGVVLTHNNIVSNVKAVCPIIPIDPGNRTLSFLPLCHVFERMVIYGYMKLGASVTYCGTKSLGGEEGELQGIKPHFFTTVPRLLEKVYEKIYGKGLELTGLKKKLFFWALDMTEDYEYDKSYGIGKSVKLAIADKLIFSKWREALGGNIKGIVTGAAPCPAKMARVFSAAGIPIREGYGLSETSPALSINRFEPGGALLGTVGPAVKGVTIKIDPANGDYKKGEGEILAQGPNIMQGYHNLPEKTAEVIDQKGWFHTGDIGKFVKDKSGKKFLKITGRKKALLKTSGGKYVAPEPIEKKFKEEFLIEQMMVVGESKKFVSALIVPSPDALKDWCSENGVACEITAIPGNPDLKEISPATLEDAKVLAKYKEVVESINPHFSHIEQIKKFKLLCQPWDVSSGELTPTMKIKRRVIRDKYKSEINKMYEE